MSSVWTTAAACSRYATRPVEALARVELRVPGEHNVLNALTALAVLRHAGVSPEAAAPHLLTFSGAARRFQLIGEHDGVTVVDDYAHHPTEITATLEGRHARRRTGA